MPNLPRLEPPSPAAVEHGPWSPWFILSEARGRAHGPEQPLDAETMLEQAGVDPQADEGLAPVAGKGSRIDARSSTAAERRHPIGGVRSTSPSRRPFSVALASALLVFASACASTKLAPPPPPLSAQAVVLETPIDIQDELYECGLISISALCGYYGVSIPEQRRLALIKTAADEKGLSGAQLRDALHSVGFEVFVFRGTMDHSETGLLRHIDARRPLIVMTSQDDLNHYSLLIGYDPQYENVVLLDPRRGRVVLPSATFDGLWADAQRFTLLAVPPGPVHADVPEPLDPKAETL